MTLMSGNLICKTKRGFDEKVMPNDLAAEVKWHVQDELAASYRVTLVIKDGQVLIPCIKTRGTIWVLGLYYGQVLVTSHQKVTELKKHAI